jgi:hypothetical protein
MPFFTFSSIRIGRQFGDLTVVQLESSQNTHMLETLDESCFFMNRETKNLTSQYLCFCMSAVAVINIKLICEYRINNRAIFIVLTMVFLLHGQLCL